MIGFDIPNNNYDYDFSEDEFNDNKNNTSLLDLDSSNSNLISNELQKMDKILDNKTAKNIMLWLITDYCRVHTIGYKETSQLAQLGIRRQILLPSPDKETTK